MQNQNLSELEQLTAFTVMLKAIDNMTVKEFINSLKDTDYYYDKNIFYKQVQKNLKKHHFQGQLIPNFSDNPDDLDCFLEVYKYSNYLLSEVLTEDENEFNQIIWFFCFNLNLDEKTHWWIRLEIIFQLKKGKEKLLYHIKYNPFDCLIQAHSKFLLLNLIRINFLVFFIKNFFEEWELSIIPISFFFYVVFVLGFPLDFIIFKIKEKHLFQYCIDKFQHQIQYTIPYCNLNPVYICVSLSRGSEHVELKFDDPQDGSVIEIRSLSYSPSKIPLNYRLTGYNLWLFLFTRKNKGVFIDSEYTTGTNWDDIEFYFSGFKILDSYSDIEFDLVLQYTAQEIFGDSTILSVGNLNKMNSCIAFVNKTYGRPYKYISKRYWPSCRKFLVSFEENIKNSNRKVTEKVELLMPDEMKIVQKTRLITNEITELQISDKQVMTEDWIEVKDNWAVFLSKLKQEYKFCSKLLDVNNMNREVLPNFRDIAFDIYENGLRCIPRENHDKIMSLMKDSGCFFKTSIDDEYVIVEMTELKKNVQVKENYLTSERNIRKTDDFFLDLETDMKNKKVLFNPGIKDKILLQNYKKILSSCKDRAKNKARLTNNLDQIYKIDKFFIKLESYTQFQSVIKKIKENKNKIIKESVSGILDLFETQDLSVKPFKSKKPRAPPKELIKGMNKLKEKKKREQFKDKEPKSQKEEKKLEINEKNKQLRNKTIISPDEFSGLDNKLKALIALRNIASLAMVLNLNVHELVKGAQYCYTHFRWPRNKHYIKPSNLIYLKNLFQESKDNQKNSNSQDNEEIIYSDDDF